VTARPGPARREVSPADREQLMAAARKAVAKAPPLTPAEMQRLAAILRAAGWGRPAPAPGDGDRDAG
jgi:hypothetical protein